MTTYNRIAWVVSLLVLVGGFSLFVYNSFEVVSSLFAALLSALLVGMAFWVIGRLIAASRSSE